jgi:hypothetical protein
MARGPSAKIVIEAGADLKSELYVALAIESLTLKEWFTREAKRFIAATKQPELPLRAPSIRKHGRRDSRQKQQ